MNKVAKFFGILALAGTVIPPALHMCKVVGEGPMKSAMLISAIMWFAAAPFWLKGGSK